MIKLSFSILFSVSVLFFDKIHSGFRIQMYEYVQALISSQITPFQSDSLSGACYQASS